MARLAPSFALLLAIAACSSTGGEVRPFAEIAAGDPQIAFDPSGTVATLTIRTTVDAVCAVVYGEE